MSPQKKANEKNTQEEVTSTEIISNFDQAAQDVRTLIRSRYPIVYIISDEQQYSIIRILNEMCQKGTNGAKSKKKLLTWDIVRGYVMPEFAERHFADKKITDGEECLDPASAIDFMTQYEKEGDTIFILTEFHHYLEDPSIQKRLRIFYENTAVNERKMIILLSTRNDGMSQTGKRIPPELENIIHIYDWPYPDGAEIEKVLKKDLIPELNETLIDSNYPQMNHSMSELQDLIGSCKGMTISQITQAAHKSLVIERNLCPQLIALEKKQIIQKSGLCDYVEPNSKMSDIGGLEVMKEWLARRKKALSDEAYSFGCDLPRGVLLLGPWGSGKSSAAKAIIREWGLPGIRIDASKLYNMYVGDSEQRTRSILGLAEAISPCILWFDEVENLLAGSESGSSASDGGTSSRVLGIISTWMSEHKGMVFSIFTANEIAGRPPKLFRKGRLDEIFVVDLPVEQERPEIFKIHIEKRLNRQENSKLIKTIDLELLAKKSYNFSGAEIEEAVNSGFLKAFDEGKRDITTKDILESIEGTIPLSITMKEEIKRMRSWQKGRAVSASKYSPEEILDKEDAYIESKRNRNSPELQLT